MSASILGIDLGTTNSVVATVDDSGDVVVLRNAVGEETTPSAVYFESANDVIVGDEAKRLNAIDPRNGVILIKRHMGTEFPFSVRGRDYTPESISALILRQLVASAQPGGEARAVITVPAYFGMREREATAQAARIAGLDVMELVDEPVAAAIHYGLTRPGARTVLVYDLGGGTFDTTVLEVEDGHVTVVATDGHSKLGGADVDERLQAIVLAQLESVIPEDAYCEFVDDEAKLGSLKCDVEAAKRSLSARSECSVVVNSTEGRITVTLKRAELEDACRDLFATTSQIIERVLGKAKAKGVSSIDEVIMVGGSSRIPFLATGLEELLGLTPRLVDPDLAVAKGAALRAHQIAGTSQLRKLTENRGALVASKGGPGTVTPVLPRAVGLLIDDSNDPAGQRQFVAHFIHANTELPAEETTKSYGTILPKQESVRIRIYEQAGSSPSEELEHNRSVLDGELTGIGELPAGSVIEVTIKVAIDGRLSVVAREPISGRELTLEAFIEGVADTAEVEELSSRVRVLMVRG